MRKPSIALLWLCGTAAAASLHFQESGFVAGRDGRPAGWTTWSARPETAPRAFVDPQQFRTRPGSLARVPDPGPRKVTVASINLRPGPTHSSAESVSQFLETVAAKVPGKTDVILLPEGITVVGTGKPFPEVAETIPGPTTARLGEVARQRASYIAACIYEREGAAIYNTAVL